ncbi:DUF3757 domain-containing protein [Paraburkholderia youngii]|uniref:DUF3757 domain-containing protein n=1 Tax=Paraburkholderia youngii TaxID=2782701 RepID=UPI001591477E|nr:DUF3757 domain-containing protein [Paraburkholderia youngii]
MKKNLFVLTLVLGASYHASAETFEGCPTRGEIKMAGSVYAATASNNEGIWLGIAKGPDEGDIKEFTSATFYPAQLNNGRASQSAVVKCSYELSKGGCVNLQYIPRSPLPALDLRDASKWRRKKWPYNPDYYECIDPAAWRCRFVLVRPS